MSEFLYVCMAQVRYVSCMLLVVIKRCAIFSGTCHLGFYFLN